MQTDKKARIAQNKQSKRQIAARFKAIEVQANQKQAYYIVNESSPENISNSEDILLLTPVSDKNGEFLKDVWIYPKSEASQPKEEVKKIVSTGVKKNFFENCWDFVTHLFSRD